MTHDVARRCQYRGHRPLTLTWALTALLVLVVFLILDLDRPRRGIIRLRYDTLLDVQASLRVAAEAPTQPGTGR